MTPSLALALARPGNSADRRRLALTAGSTAIAGALLLAALHIARLPASASGGGLADYVTQSGLRPGVVIATVLLTVPVLALTVQALRVGSVARERRMASLRLAGATPRDVRTIAATEAGGAALAGGLLAGPAYVLLWLIAGVLPPAGARMLDAPDLLDLPAWAALAPLAGVAGALAGAAIHRRAVIEPLGVRRRAAPCAPGRANLAVLITGLATVLVSLSVLPAVGRHGAAELALLVTAMVGLLFAAFAGGPRLVLVCSRVLARRRGAEALLADRRLRADPRTAGRVAGVLFVCGVALGVEALLVAQQLLGSDFGGDLSFYLVGYTMAALAVVVAAAVALVTLLVGAADGLLDARRPLAALSALGVEQQTLVRVLARQLWVVAVPAIVAGTLVGAPGVTLMVGVVNGDSLLGAVRSLVPGLVAAVVAGLALAVVARIAARLLAPMIRTATDPENLRVA